MRPARAKRARAPLQLVVDNSFVARRADRRGLPVHDSGSRCDCGSRHWLVGRASAECARCGLAAILDGTDHL